MSDLPEPIPAATLVLMRARACGPPELLMTERTGSMAFAAGALVFPGGRIDADDHRTAEGQGTEAAKVAAIRETIEETGIAPGLSPDPDAGALRNGLADGQPFAALLAAHSLAIDGEALIPFARWCPNFRETRRFDTLFFIAEAPADAPVPRACEREAARAFWASAADVLADLEAARAHAIFPTRRNLERLARFASFEEARTDAERHPVTKIVPWVEEREGTPHVCITKGIGYPVTSEALETARRR